MRLLRHASFLAVGLGHFVVDIMNAQTALLLAVLSVPLGFSYSTIGLIATLYILIGSVSQPLFGWLTDRYGPRWTIAGGVLWMAAFWSGAALAPQAWTVPLLLVAAAGSAAYHPSGAMAAAGAGEPALVFIHGGLADRTFFDGQLKAFAGRYRVIALDLAGHGESGANRTKWGIPEFGADVKAVVEAEKLKRVILFGNSLGGPTAIEAALLLPDRVIGVVGIDTFQSLDYSMTTEVARHLCAC